MFDIRRRECNEIRNLKDWRLIYGRRKVGKHILIRINFDDYYPISRTSSVLHENNELSLDAF